MRLPDFVGIGSPRCGTTWISHLLNQHPEIHFNPYFKELHYFDNNYHRGPGWYSGFFEGVPTNLKCAEFTPNYMRQRESISRILKMNPKIKLIVSLREPGIRAYSHYMQRKRYKSWTDGFDVVVGNNEEQILDFGAYGEQLEWVYENFSASQVHVIIFENMIEHPTDEMAKLFDFLGVAAFDIEQNRAPKNQMIEVRYKWLTQTIRGIRSSCRRHKQLRNLFYELLPGKKIIQSLRKLNAITGTQIKEQMNSETRKYLSEYYAKDRLLLEKLLNRKITEWST